MPRTTPRPWSLVVMCAAAALACRTTPTPAPAPAAGELARECFNDMTWYRDAAEARALYRQAFRIAAERVRASARGREAGRWAVVLDVDETVLDNSAFELEQRRRRAPYDEASWQAWCRAKQARALPGAREFLDEVRALGGKIALVSNRKEPVCEATRENLRAERLVFDLVLCRSGAADKNPRFEALRQGTAPSTLPPLEVVLWVGDNIQDFPGLFQKAMKDAPPDAYQGFGDRFVIVPNPMYGSWLH